MGIARHEDILFLLGPINHDSNEPFQVSFNLRHLSQEPQSHVSRHLVISRTACVQFATERSNHLAQTTLHRRVNILVVGLNFELWWIFRELESKS
jgi:hypothetical protein